MKTIGYHVGEVLKLEGPLSSSFACHMKKLRWAGARLCFIGFLPLGVTSGVGLYLLAPLFSYYFFGTLRFWKYARLGPRLILYAYTMAFGYLKGEFTPSVPLTTPPMTKPDLSLVQINPAWENGESCADCGKCCKKIRCPLQEKAYNQCMGYNSFYWRYFNCGRYPASQGDIDRYECPKWVMRA
jgi:hypothetical protein